MCLIQRTVIIPAYMTRKRVWNRKCPDLKTILFIYNTNNGALKSLLDYFAGSASADETDVCRLNALTSSAAGIKKEWKGFLKDLNIPSRLLDRE